MCACDFNFVCARCRQRWPLDLNPYYVDQKEDEEERRGSDISGPDFKKEMVA